MKKILFVAIAALVALASFTSCEEEENVAGSLYGSWEGDLGITHIYKGQTIKPVKCVYTFTRNNDSSTIGDGYLVETFDIPELPVVYRRLRWETWKRQNGDVGVQINLESEDVKYHIVEYNLSDRDFTGKYTSGDKTDIPFTLTRVATAPDISNVRYWGYNELLPTWHPVTYEGNIYILREYGGKAYYPENVVITFDVEPAYNTGTVDLDKAFIKEEYSADANAPWGTVLADTIRFWNMWGSYMNIHRSEGYDGYHPNYQFQDIERSEAEIKGMVYAGTNDPRPFTLKRIANPDWSSIKEWGFGKWFPAEQN